MHKLSRYTAVLLPSQVVTACSVWAPATPDYPAMPPQGEWEDDQPHGLGCSRQVLSGISYMGRFVRGQAAQVPARLSVSLGQAAAGSEKQGRRQQQAEGGDRRRTDMSEVAEAAAAGGQAPKPKPLKAGTPAAIAAAAAAAAGAQLVQVGGHSAH